MQANDIALQVVGQNIANANTPGYIRENVNFRPGPSQTDGNLVEGTGVQVHSITQQVNTFLESQLRNANANQSSADTLASTYTQLENIVGALNSSSDLSSAMNQFFSSISDVLNEPGDESVQQSAVLQGQTLAQTINSMASQVEQARSSLDSQISGMAADINGLTSQIAQLNTQIASVTGGGSVVQFRQRLDRPAQPSSIQPLSTARHPGHYPARRIGFRLTAEATTWSTMALRSRSTWPSPSIDGITVSTLEIARNQRAPAGQFRRIAGADQLA